MSAFKFNCPSCDARMAAEAEHIGMEIECPHCSNKIKVPAPVAVEKEPEKEPEKPAKKEEKPKPDSAPAKPPAKPAAPAGAPETPEAPDTDDPPPSDFALAPPEEEQIASLSTEFKIKLTEEVREIIGDGERWVKGRDDAGKQVICARMEGGKPAPLPPGDASATHFSVIGAFLRVMAEHNVMVTADGRSRMLSTEIPDAADIAKGIGGTGGQRRPGQKATDPLTLDHEECLKLLDGLVKMYNDMLDVRIAAAKPKEGKSSLGPLVDLLTQKDENGEKIPFDASELGLTLLKTLQATEERLQVVEAQADALTRQIDMLRKAAEE